MHEMNKSTSDENIFRMVMSLFVPYWPLFAILVPLCLFGSWIYLKSTTPIYQAAATLIIKDENKGVDDAKVMETMNPFDSKKIVENEIEVIQSRALMAEVVKDLQLYAPVFEDKLVGSKPAYNTSPIIIELKKPEKILQANGSEPLKFYFTYDSIKKTVKVDNKSYPIDKWVQGPAFGETKFKLNANQNYGTDKDLFYTFVHLKTLTRNLLGGLEANAVAKLSTVVRLTYNDPIPQRGEDILNHLILAYNQKAVSDRNDLAANTLTFIEDRMATVENELDKLEISIQQFKSSKGAVDLSEQGKLYLQDVGAYDRQIADDNRQLAVLNRVEEYVLSKNNQRGLVPSTVGASDPVLSSLLKKLYDSEIKYERLRKTTAENNPILIAVSNEIEKIRPSILESIRNQKNNLRASLGSLSHNADKSISALSSIPEKERALLEITREKAIKSELFAFLQRKREETALSYAPNGGDGRIVDMAESSAGPISPKSSLAYLIALVLAFGIGLAYIIMKEMMNKNVLFRSEIENYTNIPIAVELPFVPKITRKEKDGMMAKPGEAVLLDHFRQLGATLGLYDRNFSKKSVLVTSSIAGEGKSFVSTNLAYCLAQSGKKVALIDMDFLKPQTTHYFELINSIGVLDFLNNKAHYSEILKNSPENKNLFIVPVGRKVKDHTALLLNGKFDVLFEELSRDFDFVIIDSAPVNLIADVKLLAEYSHKTLYVIRHATTPLKIVKHFRQSEILKSLKDVTIVFNGVKQRGVIKGDYDYSYGYDYNSYGEAYGAMVEEKV